MSKDGRFATPLLAVNYDIRATEDDDGKGSEVVVSPDAFRIFRILLESNAERLGSKIANRSFLVPINVLVGREFSSLGKDVGCIVCGDPSDSRCSRCQVVSYCGRGAIWITVLNPDDNFLYG